jgi:hypothetical protein
VLPTSLRIGEYPEHIVKFDHGRAGGGAAETVGMPFLVHSIQKAIELRGVTLPRELEFIGHTKQQFAVAEFCASRVA